MSDQKRPYRMKRRAELEEERRRRITESAVALHQGVGPAQTSITAIAERAGVRRSTVYRHFADEDALFDACSSHFRSLNPPPDLHGWSAIPDPAARTETAFRELYGFYGRTHEMYESLFRDETLVPSVHHRQHGALHRAHDRVRPGAARAAGTQTLATSAGELRERLLRPQEAHLETFAVHFDKANCRGQTPYGVRPQPLPSPVLQLLGPRRQQVRLDQAVAGLPFDEAWVRQEGLVEPDQRLHALDDELVERPPHSAACMLAVAAVHA